MLAVGSGLLIDEHHGLRRARVESAECPAIKIHRGDDARVEAKLAEGRGSAERVTEGTHVAGIERIVEAGGVERGELVEDEDIVSGPDIELRIPVCDLLTGG